MKIPPPIQHAHMHIPAMSAPTAFTIVSHSSLLKHVLTQLLPEPENELHAHSHSHVMVVFLSSSSIFGNPRLQRPSGLWIGTTTTTTQQKQHGARKNVNNDTRPTELVSYLSHPVAAAIARPATDARHTNYRLQFLKCENNVLTDYKSLAWCRYCYFYCWCCFRIGSAS
jgi:hypothetical protein